jgi:hypothetical protein
MSLQQLIPSRTRRAGQSLIGLLVVVLIMFALYFMFLGPRVGNNGESRPSVAKQSINRAHDTSTASNISQIQMAINMYKDDNDGKAPASLDDFKKSAQGRGIPAEMYIDPVTNQPLVYDPTTGTISAPPGSGAAPRGAQVVPPGSTTTLPNGTAITVPQPQQPSDSGQ